MSWRRLVAPFGELDRGALLFYLRAHARPHVAGWTTSAPDAALLDRLEVSAPARVLDIGCGAGRHTHALAERGYDAVGIDLFERPLTLARRGVAKDFRRLSATNLTEAFEGERFDAAIDVLGPASDLPRHRLARYGEQVRAVLRPGGQWIVFSFLGEAELRPMFAQMRIASADTDATGTWIVAYS